MKHELAALPAHCQELRSLSLTPTTSCGWLPEATEPRPWRSRSVTITLLLALDVWFETSGTMRANKVHEGSSVMLPEKQIPIIPQIIKSFLHFSSTNKTLKINNLKNNLSCYKSSEQLITIPCSLKIQML